MTFARRLAPAVLAASLLALPVPARGADSPTGYYRQPALHGDVLVFAAEGDLWKVPRAGGVASRLTSHPGEESRPAISPDGTLLAFTATYEGPTEAFAMPLAGGLPKRLTFDGEAAHVAGFTPDGRVLVATRHHATLPDWQLVAVDPTTLRREPLPLAQGAEAAFDGETLYFTRFAVQGSHTKRYKGGTAQTLWRWRKGEEAAALTADYPGGSRMPMPWKGRVYFLSDRDGSMNVWSMDRDGKDLKAHTAHKGWDVRWASLSEGRVAYQLGADLRMLDLATGKDEEVPIRLASDLDQRRETWVRKPVDYVTSMDLSPKGDRVALVARGQVFVAPVKQGRLVQVARRPGVRYRRARFFPDGRSLAVLSDESGEVEAWRLAADGTPKAEPLTKGGTVLRWDAVPSPDGRYLAHHDKDQRLFLLDLEKRTERKIAESPVDDFKGLAWSPDGRWLAFVETGPNLLDRIRLCRAETGEVTAVTSDRYDSYAPVFSPDGDVLWFLSDRNLESFVGAPWGSRQPEPYFGAPTEVFGVLLRKDGRSPFAPADELHPAEPPTPTPTPAAGAPASAGAAAAKSPKPVEIDREGLAERLVKAPAPAGLYESLATDGKRLYYLSVEASAEETRKKALQVLPIVREKPQPKPLVPDVKSYALSADGKRLLVRKGDDLYAFDAGEKAPEKLEEAKLDLSRWSFSFEPREEWRQMLREAWRLERDYFYDRGMHGLDWPAVLRKYEPLADRVTSRAELSDILGMMIGELSALHMFVRGGDLRKGPDDVAVASIGAETVPDPTAGGHRVTRVYRGDPDDPASLSPLARPESRVAEGDVIVAVNGTPTASVADLGQLLRNQAGRQVLLTVKPGGASTSQAARDVIATPLTPDKAASLRYADWELSRRERVEKAGAGRIGYVHLREMGGEDYSQFARDFYPVFDREGLIVDVRHNRGGNIDSWLLSRLLRKAWFYWQPRIGRPSWNMQGTFRGHVAVLIDAFTASDGEAFAEGARRLLGARLIGQRTWGGEIWLSSSNFLADKGIATAAETGVYGPEGEWLIEGHGVEPDVSVDNLPAATYRGEDAQLDAAVKHLLERLAKEPVPVPEHPPYPKKGVP